LHRRRAQAGSITPVWLALLVATLLLLIVFIDREWVNYQLKKVDQTADFAAEAGAATAEITYKLQIQGTRYRDETTPVCDPPLGPGLPASCRDENHLVPSPDTDQCTGSLHQLNGEAWRQRCHCDQAKFDGAWLCESAVVKDLPEITWPVQTEDVIQTTFAANWVDHPNSHVTLVEPYLDQQKRTVTVTVSLYISSPFGGRLWSGRVVPLRGGKAIVIVPELTLR
jgi:hypothetical protein